MAADVGQEVDVARAACVVVKEGGGGNEVVEGGEQPTLGVALFDEGFEDQGNFEAEILGVGDDTAESVELAGEDVALGGFIDVGVDGDESGESDLGKGGLNAFVVESGEEAARGGGGDGNEEEVQKGHFVVVEVGVVLGLDAQGRGVDAVEAQVGGVGV